MSNLTTRVLVALVSIPIILLLTMAGGFYFFGFVTLLSSLALHEFYQLARRRGAVPQTLVGLLFGVCINAAFFHYRLQFALLELLATLGIAVPLPSMTQLVLILLLLFVPLVLLVELFRNKGTASRNIGVTLFGVLYVSLFMGSLIGLRELFIPQDFPVYLHFDVHGIAVPSEVVNQIYDWGGYTIITIFAAIWLCDSAAYFAGTWWGKHKLFPRVSPNKSWEGAVAGFIVAVLAFVVARSLVLPYMSVTTACVCGGMVGLFGQLGDMVESLIKRDTGVKDSSNLIPGHGGVLDRFDSLMFVAPLLFFYLDFVVF